MKEWTAILLLAPMIALGQGIPEVHFNHLYYFVEPADFKSITESAFVKDTLCAVETRADSTATYLFGPSSYLELFHTAGHDSLLGFSGIALSVDGIGDLESLRGGLYTESKPPIRTIQRVVEGQKIAWFDALAIGSDSTFHAHSRVFLWIMEYRTEYFEHKKYAIIDQRLTRERYLQGYAPTRAGKILKRLTGVVMRLSSDEKAYMVRLFKNLGYRPSGEDSYLTPDDFRFLFKERVPGDRNALESVEFETAVGFPERTMVKISDSVLVVLSENEGHIMFK